MAKSRSARLCGASEKPPRILPRPGSASHFNQQRPQSSPKKGETPSENFPTQLRVELYTPSSHPLYFSFHAVKRSTLIPMKKILRLANHQLHWNGSPLQPCLLWALKSNWEAIIRWFYHWCFGRVILEMEKKTPIRFWRMFWKRLPKWHQPTKAFWQICQIILT